MKEAYVLDLSPFALQFSGNFGIRWYGLAYLAGFAALYLIAKFFAERSLSPIKPEKIGDFVFSLAIGTVVGGRLGYCLFYNQALFTKFTSTAPFWGVLAINEGGMASHGGIIGIVVAAWLSAHKNNIPFLHLLDLATLGGTLGVFFGRIANFVNGELVGRPVQSAVSWAVKFPQDILTWPDYEPSKLASLGPVVAKLGIDQHQWEKLILNYPYTSNSIYSALSQIIDQIQSGSLEFKLALAELLEARHPSQLYESFLEGLLLFLLLIFIWRIPRKAGVLAATFGLAYPIVRIFGEQFRMPDLQIGFQLYGLTRGQWLSFAMLALGVFLTYLAAKSCDAKFGGWLNNDKFTGSHPADSRIS